MPQSKKAKWLRYEAGCLYEKDIDIAVGILERRASPGYAVSVINADGAVVLEGGDVPTAKQGKKAADKLLKEYVRSFLKRI